MKVNNKRSQAISLNTITTKMSEGKATKINEEIKSINKKEHKCEIIKVKNKYEERHILLIKKIN